MHNTLKRAVIATNQKAQYDAKVKNLLGHKIILAHILTRTVDEFKGMNPRKVIPYIEGTPSISKVPIEPGMTNPDNQPIASADYRSEYGKRGNKRGTDKI
mgnify:CR=1 FL=1